MVEVLVLDGRGGSYPVDFPDREDVTPIYKLGEADIAFTETMRGWLAYPGGPAMAAREIVKHVFKKKPSGALYESTNVMPIYASLPEPAPLSTTTMLYLEDIRRYTAEQDALKIQAQVVQTGPTAQFRLFADDSVREVHSDEQDS